MFDTLLREGVIFGMSFSVFLTSALSSSAAADGRLREGDVLVSVDGVKISAEMAVDKVRKLVAVRRLLRWCFVGILVLI